MNARIGEVLGIELSGSASAFPSDVDPSLSPLSNADVWKMLFGEEWRGVLLSRGWSETYPEEEWGVRRREWWGRETSSDRGAEGGAEALARVAAERVLVDAQLTGDDLDLVVAATSTPGRITRSLAHHVGRAIGTDAAGIDVRSGGAGALAAWTTAALHLAHGARRALVVAAEVPSVYRDPNEPSLSMLYGDGAAAIVLTANTAAASGLLGAVSGGASYSGRAFTVPGALPPRAGDEYRFQKPDATYRGALRRSWDEASARLRDLSGGTPDHLLPYAVTREQIERTAAIVGASPAFALELLSRYGCTGCSGPLIALHELRDSGSLRGGETIGLEAVAGGIAWHAMLWRA